jgi:DNA-binding NtrC family response regulator
MSHPNSLPRILVVDDAFGRILENGRNPDREALCAQLLLSDVSDRLPGAGRSEIRRPVADAVFLRGQRPVVAATGDRVENDPEGVLGTVAGGWDGRPKGTPRWALVLLDLCFFTGLVTERSQADKGKGMPEGRPGEDHPDGYFGFTLLGELTNRFPDLPVVIFSSMPKDEKVTALYNARGARGFLAKSGLDASNRLEELLWTHGLFADPSGEIVGTSRGLLLALRQARVCGRHRRKVLIRGERGTGKELMARFLHRHAVNRADAKLVTVNSPVLTDDLFAAELFGYRRGAFTGATTDRTGLVDEAEGGTLFLDEIKDLSPRVQAGLLRVLQEGQVTPVGSNKPHPVDVRFLSASDADVEALAAAGEFRPALLDRLREGGTVLLPPLRYRGEDLPLLVESLLRRAELVTPGAVEREVTGGALDLLMDHPWPDNIRGLQAVLSNAVAAYPENDQLVERHLRIPDRAVDAPPGPTPDGMPTSIQVPETAGELEKFQALGLAMEELAGELSPGELAQAFVLCERVHARTVATLLRAAAALNLRFDAKARAEVSLQPTMRLLTGRPELKTTEGKRLLAQLLKLAPEEIEDLLDDPILAQLRSRAD